MWAVSTQQTTDKRKCAACCTCGQQFSRGEARLQQWSNRNSHCAFVDAQCVNGGVAHDHELHPKQPTDQDAVEYVARQCDCVTQAAADSEILLLITASSDQASTAAPANDEPSLYGREEALRLDEEIINFQWFDSTKDLRGTTYVQPPPRFRFAFRQAQHAILRAIVYPGPSSPASESAWKVLVLSSWLLLGRPAINASESNCAHFLEARLDLFWSEDWPALWATVRAECDVARLQHLTQFSCRTETVTCPQSCHPCFVRRTRTRPGVSVARRLMLPQPAASDPSGVVLACPEQTRSRADLKPVDAHQHHCFGYRCGGGVDRRHAAVARCLADVIHSHNGTKMYIEQSIPALTRVVNGQVEHARMDLVFDQNGTTTYLDVAIVSPLSSSPALIAAANRRPSHMAQRAEKGKFDRYPHVNLVPFILETN